MRFRLKTMDGIEWALGAENRKAVPCFRCGLCCTYFLIKLTNQDIRVLAQGLGLTRREFMGKFVKKTPVGPVLRQKGNDCIFLDQDETRAVSGCSVYPFRPEVCRNWVPSLSRSECQEGLRRLGKGKDILLVHDVFASESDAGEFCSLVSRDGPE